MSAPNDSLFDFGDDSVTTDPAMSGNVGSEGGASDESGNGAPRSVTMEDVQNLLTPLQSKLQETERTLRESRDENRTLQGQLQALAQQTRLSPDTNSDEDFLDAFTNDPKGAVEKVAQTAIGQMREQLSPVLMDNISTMHSMLVDSQKSQIESQFGPGVWEEHFEPVFSERVSQMRRESPARLASADWLRNEINGIKGHKMDALIEARAKRETSQKASREAQEQQFMSRFNTTGLQGGVGPMPNGAKRELTEDEREYIRAKKAAGIDTDIESLRKLVAANKQGRANTLDDFKSIMGNGKK